MKTDSPDFDAIRERASEWLARRDGGWDAVAAADFASWCEADPRHAAAVRELESAWQLLDQPRRTGRNDVVQAEVRALGRRRRQRLVATGATVFALAACVAVLFWPRGAQPLPAAPLTEAHAAVAAVRVSVPEQMVLSDGSTVELSPGSRIEVDFSPSTRRVRLINGHAHFEVAKNPERPFIVSASDVEVRAVGTAFAVKVGSDNVEVVVTEGRVAVDHHETAAAEAGEVENSSTIAFLEAGNFTVVRVAPDSGPSAAPEVVTLAPDEIKRGLAWRLPRLQFTDATLQQAIALFNEHNALQLEIGDAAVASMRLDGDFRADNVEGFIALLELNFGVKAGPRSGNRIALHQAR